MELIPAQYSSNIILICLIFLYAIFNILAWGKNGLYTQEIESIKDTKNERTFTSAEIKFDKIKPFLSIQYYLFFGLCLFVSVIPEPAESLSGLQTLSASVYLKLAICIAAPVIWFFLQKGLFHWTCFIFGGDSRIVILERVYNAIHFLAGPLVLFLFSAIVVTELSSFWSAILLTSIFIITQLTFIFSGFKVFLNGIGSFCLIFVYLCALEITPLAIIYAKLG